MFFAIVKIFFEWVDDLFRLIGSLMGYVLFWLVMGDRLDTSVGFLVEFVVEGN